MPGRIYNNSSNTYRYGFNGKEKDGDIDGNNYDYGFRIYNPGLVRFLSVDPLQKKYPELTPYQFASNCPIGAVDLDGLEAVWYTTPVMFSPKSAMIGKAVADGVKASVKKTWSFVTSDMWKASTYINAEELLFESGVSMSSVKVSQTPMVNAKVDDFIKNVINGDIYSRTRYISEFTTDVLTAYITSKGLGSIGSFANNFVKTNFGIAKQSLTIGALKGAAEVKTGATLYRIGTQGVSAQGEAAQFWSLENPLLDPEGYAKKYNVPLANVKNANFIEVATLKKGANFVTREAGSAPGSANTGKGIEVVVDKAGTTNNKITPITNNSQ